VIAAGGGSNSYSIRAAASGNGWVDEFLEARPLAIGKPTRRGSVYACPELGCCARYAQSEPHLALSYRIYEVVPRGPAHTAPMVLVGRILARGNTDEEVGAMADEYWKPTLGWRYMEVLAETFDVRGEVSSPDLLTTLSGGSCYDEDVMLAVRRGW
jgi:hypothetical protein